MGTHQLFYLITCFLLGATGTSCAQEDKPRLVGKCEGCEAIFEYGSKQLNPVDTLPGYNEAATKIKVSGVVYQPDGRTPAEGVILYVYQTNEAGTYPTQGTETDWAARHGYVRGWVKTGRDGRYTFYTQKPGTYPSRSEPAHIHLVVLEPDGRYYWLDDFLFAGDPLLTAQHLSPRAPVGGDGGVLHLKREHGQLTGERNLTLGKNVQGYGK